MKRLMGIDYGSKRVGVALTDETGHFALPHSVLPRDKHLISKLTELCRDRVVSQIVVGESKNLSGAPNPIMSQINLFVEELKDHSGLPVVLEPEFYTSAEAERLQGKNIELDASAAALILKSYIDRVKP